MGCVYNYALTKGKATESDTDVIFQPFPFLSQLMPTKIAASGDWLSPRKQVKGKRQSYQIVVKSLKLNRVINP